MSARTRSEYRLVITPGQFTDVVANVVALHARDREGLARLMLDAYRGTIDDEGETINEALEAVDHSLANCLVDHSVVLKDGEQPVGMSLVLIVDDIHYIDPVAVAESHKRQGLGRRLVATSLASIARTGVTEIGATITDGNKPSERLFAGLGAKRIGPWPPQRTQA